MTSASPPPAGSDPSSRLTLQWRTVAAASLFVTLAALTGLAIIAATKRADTLATTALVLAIIAFIAQLMIFIAQTGAAATQERRSADINATTLGLLAEIKATSAGSDQLLREQFGAIVRQLLRTAIPRGAREAVTASKKDFDPEEFARNFARNIEDSVRSQLGDAYVPATEQPGESDDDWQPPELSPADQAKLHLLEKWPESDIATRLYEELAGLRPMCLLQFAKMAEDYRFSLRLQVGPGLYGTDSPIAERLVQLGLVERFDNETEGPESPGRYRYTLSDHGRDVARLVTPAFGEMPDYVKQLDLSHSK